MMILTNSLIVLTLIALIVASYEDLKKREVYNWISYGLLITAFCLRVLFSMYEGWSTLVSGLAGFGICLAIGMLFYLTNQWGGADSMLLMALGMVIGADFIYYPDSWDLLIFIGLILLVGAIYGLIWGIGEAIVKKKRFVKVLKKKLKERIKERNISIGFSIFFILLGLVFFDFVFLSPIPIMIFYLFIGLSSIEESCFLKMRAANKLVPGDWLVKRVKIGKDHIESKSLEIEDLRELVKYHNDNKILIKEGLPFVPNFLICYILLIFGQNMLKMLFVSLF